MLISQIISNPIFILYFLAALIVAITIHEFSHALVANFLGDPTPARAGRLSLNPLRHLDPIGTIFLLVAGFGWGKPVYYDPTNLKRGRLDELIIALSGPLSNIIVAAIFAIPYRLANSFGLSGIENAFYYDLFNIITELNLILAVFNLLPIPPLDGSKILYLFVSEKTRIILDQIGIPILFVLIIISRLSQFDFLSKFIFGGVSWLLYLVRIFPG